MIRNLCLAVVLMAALSGCGTQSAAPLVPDTAEDWGRLDPPPTETARQNWPRAAPAFVAAYPGARLASTDVLPRHGTISFRTDDEPAAVVSYYRARVRAAGMPVAEMDTDGPVTRLAAGNDRRSLTVDAATAGAFTTVSLVWDVTA